jgi:hypothetical protein
LLRRTLTFFDSLGEKIDTIGSLERH